MTYLLTICVTDNKEALHYSVQLKKTN